MSRLRLDVLMLSYHDETLDFVFDILFLALDSHTYVKLSNHHELCRKRKTTQHSQSVRF